MTAYRLLGFRRRQFCLQFAFEVAFLCFSRFTHGSRALGQKNSGVPSGMGGPWGVSRSLRLSSSLSKRRRRWGSQMRWSRSVSPSGNVATGDHIANWSPNALPQVAAKVEERRESGHYLVAAHGIATKSPHLDREHSLLRGSYVLPESRLSRYVTDRSGQDR